MSEDNDPALSINDWVPPKSNAPERIPILRSRMHQRTEGKKGLPLRVWLINKPIVEIASINSTLSSDKFEAIPAVFLLWLGVIFLD